MSKHCFDTNFHENIPTNNRTRAISSQVSKSWANSSDSEYYRNKFSMVPSNPLYDAMGQCKSAGVIPYTIVDGQPYFLFQKEDTPQKKKDGGWNDFGGKKINPEETTAETAGREFSEETSCLFYLAEQGFTNMYDLLKDNTGLIYDEQTINQLKYYIPLAQKFYANRITEFVSPISASSKEIYITYFVKVPYIPATDLPRAEDIHIAYEDRYCRTCQWFTVDEIMLLNEKDFHKRLQIVKIQKRIHQYDRKGLFI